METYTTEEQQVEAIKRFWRENGISIVVGVVAGLAGVGGYNYYQEETVKAQEAQSVAYNEVVESISPEKAESFIKANSDSGYAELAALMLAKTFAEESEYAKAEKQLAWVVANADKVEIKALANYRLARVLVAQDKSDDALAITNQTFPAAFEARVDELKGDIYLQKGENDKARDAYQAAADNGGLNGNPVLQMKLDDLAVNSQLVAS
ncbi:YfgM family protein [Algibacillus agarilyticus]|uniref:YfgM family protein n=1 Tax=Algibacillus agarilyticus TaxID=2234133 RepID=UPI000DD0DB24|nr:tetratricopeptide repeat protein [Algibacillus agarilyticus]